MAVPGMGDLRSSYRELVRPLADAGCRVAVTDLRGHGESDTTFREYGDIPTARDILALVEALGGGPGVVLGSSMGASAAAWAAAERPSAVASLVLFAPFLREPKASAFRRRINHLLYRIAFARTWGVAFWAAYYRGTLNKGTKPEGLDRAGTWARFRAQIRSRVRMPRAGLSRRAITEAALDVIDAGGAGGFDRLTLAAVAARVSVAVPSLYKHVSLLAELRRDVAVAPVIELNRWLSKATVGRASADAVRALADTVREFAHRHPGRYAATQIAAAPGDAGEAALAAAGAESVAIISAVLRGFDLDPGDTVDVVRVVRSALHGFVMLELSGGFRLPDDLDRSFGFLVDALIAGVEQVSGPPGRVLAVPGD